MYSVSEESSISSICISHLNILAYEDLPMSWKPLLFVSVTL